MGARSVYIVRHIEHCIFYFIVRNSLHINFIDLFSIGGRRLQVLNFLFMYLSMIKKTKKLIVYFFKRWWWRSVLTSASTGLFVLAYACFFYVKRSNMSGGLQTLQFFGYTILTCLIFSLMLGAVGYFASLKFIRYIYLNIKMD
jgi:hypothetical protein